MSLNVVLIASLAKLRDEFNNIAPGRDKASDGWIGDAAHAASKSDHNPDTDGAVHAIDVDRDLRTPGLSMEKVVQFLLARCRSGQEARLRYIIFDRRIWSASSGWRQNAYTGANPHDHHAHFSGSYETAKERSVASWRLADLIKEEDVAFTTEDKAFIQEQNANLIKELRRRDIDPWATIFARTDASTNKQLPALLAAVSALPAADVDEEVIVNGINEGLSDKMAEALLNKLQARLAG